MDPYMLPLDPNESSGMEDMQNGEFRMEENHCKNCCMLKEKLDAWKKKTHEWKDKCEAAQQELASLKEVHGQIGEYLAPAMPAWHPDYQQHTQPRMAKPKGHQKRAEPPIGQTIKKKVPQQPKCKPPQHLLVKKHRSKDPQQSKSQGSKGSKGSKGGKGSKRGQQLMPPPPVSNPNFIPLHS